MEREFSDRATYTGTCPPGRRVTACRSLHSQHLLMPSPLLPDSPTRAGNGRASSGARKKTPEPQEGNRLRVKKLREEEGGAEPRPVLPPGVTCEDQGGPGVTEPSTSCLAPPSGWDSNVVWGHGGPKRGGCWDTAHDNRKRFRPVFSPQPNSFRPAPPSFS